MNITGGGFQPGETVTLHFQEVPYYDSPSDLTATVQSDGTFSNSQFSPDSFDQNIRFYLYATGSGSGSQAQTTFTDMTHLGGFQSVGAQTPNPVAAGSSATYLLTLTSNGNGTCSATLSITTSLPTGVTSSFSSNPITLTGGTGTSTLTLTTTSSTPPGSTSFTIDANAPSEGGGQGCSGGDFQTGQSGQPANPTLVVGAANTSLAVSSATGNYGGTVTLSATLTSGSTGVSGKSISFTLNGTSVGSATTNTSGVATFSGASLSGINAGTYSSGVGASFSGDSSYNSSTASAELTVNKTTATVTLSNLTQTYTGSPLTPTATTSPTGLSITWMGAPQTNAGTYPVTATVNDSNYEGSVSGTFTINKAVAQRSAT